MSGWGITDEEGGADPHKLSSPMVFFWSMVIFLILTGFVAAILYRQIQAAFMSNPGLNGLILGVLAGTYSTIFIACPIVVAWDRFFGSTTD